MNQAIEVQGPVDERLGRKYHYKLYTIRRLNKQRTTISLDWSEHKKLLEAFGSERELSRRVHRATKRILERGYVGTLSGTVAYELGLEAGAPQ